MPTARSGTSAGRRLLQEGISCYGGCANWVADHNIVAIATNEVLEPEMYHMSCLRDDHCPQPEEGDGGQEPRAWRRDA